MKGKLYCCCAESNKNCYITCPKSKRLQPDHFILIPSWPKIEGRKK